MHVNRRKFINQTLLLGSAMGMAPLLSRGQAVSGAGTVEPIDPALAKEYVGVAHRDLDGVKAIVEKHPLILNAAWDWGDGDFETALGAAGHVGRRDIAEYLLEKGARADIFVLTMLGETNIVQATLERFPALLNAFGPHGFTLLHHAKKGGEAALPLHDYLVRQGLTETFVNIYNKKK